MSRSAIDMKGKSFGAWLVLRRAGSALYGAAMWVAACTACGVEREIRGDSLRLGGTKSCGCGGHGHASHVTGKSPTYQTWTNMLQRCRNPNYTKFNLYGGRGIQVCDKWLSFEAFLADVRERPVGKTLDRIDNNKGYAPDNCRWATVSEQNSNRRPYRKQASP